jgi:signal transduction histidine kinase/CheY-like chemotaxis protein/HPt (histidine-containing phosphotransfer) domain-containing protein
MSIIITSQGENKPSAENTHREIDFLCEEEYETIINLASVTCNTPICLIALLDGHKNSFLKNLGLSSSFTPREILFFEHTMKSNGVYEVPDVSQDELFRDSAFTANHKEINFYAGVPLVNSSGGSIGCLCVMDYKARRLTEEQKLVMNILAKQVMIKMDLRTKNIELERLAQCKEDFLSNMSHELRTPMNAISGYADLLANSKLNDDQHDMLRTIKSSVDVLITILNDVLDFAKINSGKLNFDNKIFNLKSSVGSIYDLLNLKAKEKNILFNIEYVNKLPDYIKGDRVRLLQILTNLIGNAIKFTENGCVSLKTELLEELQESYSIRFDVIDTGIGIPKEKLNKIFERFEQAEICTYGKYGGTGLGLSITKSLVELQNGIIEISSTVNKGSTFSVVLKFSTPGVEELNEHLSILAASVTKKQHCFKNMKVLLAEDTTVNTKLIKKVLEGTNCHIDDVENGLLCIDKLKNCNYDLILMDLHMPHMNGYETTEYIRKQLKLNTPIVALTANACLKEKDRCLNIGMNDYLTKPFKFEDLYQVINKYINKQRLKKYFMTTIKLRPTADKLKTIDRCKFFKLRSLGSTTQQFHLESPKKLNRKLTSPYSKKLFSKLSISFLNTTNNSSFESVNFMTLKDYTDNDSDLIKELTDQFIKDLPSYLSLLKDSIIARNFVDIKNIAHKMKSPLGMFGMEITKNILEEIEDLAVTYDIGRIKERFIYCESNIRKSVNDLLYK